VLDNLVYGHRGALPAGVKFHEASLADAAALDRILAVERVDLVMHFAAYCYVGESVKTPLKYYLNNVTATYTLLDAMVRHGVTRFVFPSTCATYGVPASLPIVENMKQAPINPYGQTKLDVETALRALAHAKTISFAAFRY